MLHTETVEGTTLELLRRLQSESMLDSFCLAGEIALALYLGHRKSIDLDLFTPYPFDVLLLKDFLETKYGFRTDFLEKNTLKGSINGVKIDCITHAYERLGNPCMEDGIRLYALEDIVAMKLSAIADNDSRLKDFIDIAFLSTRLSFYSMLKCYEHKFPKSNVIRPILRGRDVCRYGYEWANLWIINTHNGIKGVLERIHIEDYPAIKQHLDKYWDKIEPRADQGDTAYNLRNCAYLDEFSKPKIIYPNMTKFLPFVYDRSGVMTNQKCFIITGTHLEYLTAFFNSSLFKFCFADRFPELQGKTRELSKIFMDEISILKINDTDECMINKLVQDIQMEYSVNKAKRIDKFIFDLYHLSIEEQMYIGFIDYGEK